MQHPKVKLLTTHNINIPGAILTYYILCFCYIVIPFNSQGHLVLGIVVYIYRVRKLKTKSLAKQISWIDVPKGL
jgi:hypothetical protein